MSGWEGEVAAVHSALEADLGLVPTPEQRYVMHQGACHTFKEAYDLLTNAILVQRIRAPITPAPPSAVTLI